MSLRIGVLGASRIAENTIVGPAHDLGHRLVVVAAAPDPQRARQFATRTVSNGLPPANALHAPWNLAAIKAGIARNHTEAHALADAARSAGANVLEGIHYLSIR